MRISISNIAWNPDIDFEVAKTLNAFKIDAIDIAPDKYFDTTKPISRGDILNVRKWWEANGVELIGMQSLMFRRGNLNILDVNQSKREEALDHLTNIATIANVLGIKTLTFGSPRNRVKGSLSKEKADAIAIDFFRDLSKVGEKHAVTFCIEANPGIYNCDFLMSTSETAAIIKEIDRENIKLQFDTGTIFLNKESYHEEFRAYCNLIGHIHISEPHLAPIGSSDQHLQISKLLKNFLPQKCATIEMLTKNSSSPIDTISEAIKQVTKVYK